MEATRRHPDIFTAEEAAAYLSLDSVRSLESIRENYGLVWHVVCRTRLFHRRELDRVANLMMGIKEEELPAAKGRR